MVLISPDQPVALSQSLEKTVVVPLGRGIFVHGPVEEPVEYSHKYVKSPLPPLGRDELVIVVGSKLLQPL